MKSKLAIYCAAIAAIVTVPQGRSMAQETPHFDVNDVAFLVPPPAKPEDVEKLISGDDALANGSTVWPKEFFEQVINFAENDPSTKIGSSTIKFPAKLKDLHNWKVAGIRVNPASLGGSDGMIGGIQKLIDALKGSGKPLPIDAPIVPGIRLVMQPVTIEGTEVKIHDFAAHVVFNQKAVKTGPELVASEKMQSIVKDLIELKKMTRTDGVELGVHPGFAVEGFRERLAKFVTSQLDQKDFDVVSFMGLPEGQPEPWIFFRVKRATLGGMGMEITPIGGFAAPAPTSMMLAVLEDPVVKPSPKALETPLGAIGISTAPLFPDSVQLADPVFSASNGPLKTLKFADLPDYVANPELANTLNTDCVSCHTETTRRLTHNLGDKPLEERAFAYRLQDKTISQVSASVTPPRPSGISWNVRVFGWGPRRGAPTISQRGANEAMESADFFNRVFFKKPQ